MALLQEVFPGVIKLRRCTMRWKALFVVCGLAVLSLWAVPRAGAGVSLDRGKKVYRSLCVNCHGWKGEGDGPGARIRGIRAGDLSNRAYMSLLSDQELYDRIAYGQEMFPFIQMPGWKERLSPDEIRDVVAYIRLLEKDKGPLEGPTPQERERRYREDPLEKGHLLYMKYCSNCHGEKGDGRGWAAEKLEHRPADFTDHSVMDGLNRWDIINYIKGRAAPEGERYMPEFGALDEEMIDSIVNYVEAIRRGETGARSTGGDGPEADEEDTGLDWLPDWLD